MACIGNVIPKMAKPKGKACHSAKAIVQFTNPLGRALITCDRSRGARKDFNNPPRANSASQDWLIPAPGDVDGAPESPFDPKLKTGAPPYAAAISASSQRTTKYPSVSPPGTETARIPVLWDRGGT